jgi:spermidine synthase
MVLDRLRDRFGLYTRIELAIICFSIGCPLVVLGANEYLGGPSTYPVFRLLFLVASFVSGLLVGSQFPLANRLYLGTGTSPTKTAGLLYAADLLGGWFGGMFGAAVLMPILGLVGTCIIVGLLKLASFVVLGTQPLQDLRGGIG